MMLSAVYYQALWMAAAARWLLIGSCVGSELVSTAGMIAPVCGCVMLSVRGRMSYMPYIRVGSYSSVFDAMGPHDYSVEYELTVWAHCSCKYCDGPTRVFCFYTLYCGRF
jgi:hypothetical protein